MRKEPDSEIKMQKSRSLIWNIVVILKKKKI